MGTISSALSSSGSLTNPVTVTGSDSSSASAGGSSSGGLFTGASAYSQDLQNVISRSVAIASLPITELTNQQNGLNSQASELTTLDTDFAAVQSSLQSIQDALGGAGMQTTVSDPAVAGVTVGDGATQGAYTITVSSIGAYATSLTSQSWDSETDPSGQPTTYNLVVGGDTYAITPADNDAASVASAINAQYGNVVQATAVNVGTTESPDYRISLQSATLGPSDVELALAPQTDLQGPQSTATGNATSLTAATWDSSGDPSTYTLAVDGTNYTISPADNTAAGVAAAINAISGSPVRATVVDLGTAGSPDYRIQLQAASSSVANVDLLDSSADSLQQQETPVTAAATISQTRWSWDATSDSSGNPTQYTLTVNGSQQTFTAGDDSAQSVAAAINALAGNPVAATVVNLGTDAAPDYRIQLVNNTGSTDSPQLTRDTAFGLQTQGDPPGSLASYEIANSGKTVTSNSRSVTIAAGTTLTLAGTGTTNVTVSQSASTLSDALSGFADAYNAAVAELAKQRGQAGGPLQGQSIVNSLSNALAALSTYGAANTSIGMADLGFTLNVDGTLTYSPLTLMGTDLLNAAGVTAFLGSPTGGGFLKAATQAMEGVEDPATGILKTTETNLQSQITSLGNTITQKQAKVAQLQTQLTSQMAQADAMIAQMEQQYSYLASMFAAQQTADQMYANG